MNYRPDRKGGHRHNHVMNARRRGNVCPYCDGIIARGFGVRRYDGVLFCTYCGIAAEREYIKDKWYLLALYS